MNPWIDLVNHKLIYSCNSWHPICKVQYTKTTLLRKCGALWGEREWAVCASLMLQYRHMIYIDVYTSMVTTYVVHVCNGYMQNAQWRELKVYTNLCIGGLGRALYHSPSASLIFSRLSLPHIELSLILSCAILPYVAVVSLEDSAEYSCSLHIAKQL